MEGQICQNLSSKGSLDVWKAKYVYIFGFSLKFTWIYEKPLRLIKYDTKVFIYSI